MSPKRRANGESSIHKDKNGVWHGHVTMGKKPNGEDDRRHRQAPTLAKIRAKVRKLEQERDRGAQSAVGANMTVEQWLLHWLEYIAPIHLRYKTVRGHRTNITKHLIPALGHHKLAKLTGAQVETFYSSMARATVEVDGVAKRRYRPATVDYVLATLRGALKDAWLDGHVGSNVAWRVRRQKDQSVEAAAFVVEPFDVEAARRIIETARNRRNGVRYVLALTYGLRQGEALGLSWPKVNLDSAVPKMWLTQQLQPRTWEHGCGTVGPDGAWPCLGWRGAACPKRRDGGLVLVQVKTARSNRPLELNEPTVRLLREHRAAQEAERKEAGNLWVETNLLFTQPNGKPIGPRADLREWKKLLADAGVREARLHDARHTATTLLLELGVDPRAVMEMMGWTSVTMLHRYQHVVESVRVDAAKRMGDLLH